MLEYFAPGFIYTLTKDVWANFRGSRRRLSPSEVLALRQKWKGAFETHIAERHHNKLRKDVIIRDMKRIDSYPDTLEGKGISSWFRVGLVGTYHRGILVGLNWGTLVEEADGLRFRNYKAEEQGDLKAMLIGRIPYENIESVDWEGDEYYGLPHIYCFFTYKKEPYEGLSFYEEIVPPHGIPFFTELRSYESVRRRSRKRGLDSFL